MPKHVSDVVFEQVIEVDNLLINVIQVLSMSVDCFEKKTVGYIQFA